MKKTVILLIIILSFLSACRGKQEMLQNRESYTNLFNDAVDGIQEEKLQQAREGFFHGNFSRSLEIYRDLLPGFIASDNQEAVMNILFYIASSQIELGRYDLAKKTLQASLFRISLMMDSSSKKKEYLVLYMLEMGELLTTHIQHEDAGEVLGFLKHCFYQASLLGSNYLQMRAYKNLGAYFVALKKWSLAEENLNLAFIMANKLRRKHFFVQSALFLARVYRGKKNYSAALEKLVQAYRVYQKDGYYYRQALTLKEIGKVFLEAKYPGLALRYFQRAYEMFKASTLIENSIKNKHIPGLERQMGELKLQKSDFRDENIFNVEIF